MRGYWFMEIFEDWNQILVIVSCWTRTCTNTCSIPEIISSNKGYSGYDFVWGCMLISNHTSYFCRVMQGIMGYLKLAVDDFPVDVTKGYERGIRGLFWPNLNGQKRPCWNWDQHDAGKYGHYKPNGLRVHLQHRGGYLCGANRAGACNALTESALELLALRYARGQDHLVEMRKKAALLAPAAFGWWLKHAKAC